MHMIRAQTSLKITEGGKGSSGLKCPLPSATQLFPPPSFLFDCCLRDRNNNINCYWPYNMAMVLTLDTLD